MKHAALRSVTALGAWTLLLGMAGPARAQSNRVFASARSGNDLNACSNINTPCQTLQGAVNQVAAGGAVLILDSGGYGPVTLNKSVSIEAPPGIEAFIHPPSGNAITVQAGGSDVVVLRGLTLSVGVGTVMGVEVLRAGAVHVERCVIQGFYDGIIASRDIGAPVYADVYVDDTLIRNSSFNGISIISNSGTVRATVDRCHIVGSANAGIHAFINSQTAVWKTLAAGNDVGFLLAAQGLQAARMAIEQCAAGNNKHAGIQADGNVFDSPATLWLSNSTITGNGTGTNQLNTSQLLSRINNTVEGNAVDISGSPGTYTPR